MTVTALMASGVLDGSLNFHIQNAKNHGVTKDEIAEILTHAAVSQEGRKLGLRSG